MAAVVTSRRGRLHSERGAELIEFALVLPVLLLVLGGMFDFGIAINQYTILNNAAREGARVAAMPGWEEGDVQERVESYVQDSGLSLDALETSVDFGVNVDAGSHSVPAVTVSVTYVYDYLLLDSFLHGFFAEEFPTTLTLKAASTMRTEVAAGL